ncbi:hypothetical protein ScPMuIL_016909, partial [Solemya velum]
MERLFSNAVCKLTCILLFAVQIKASPTYFIAAPDVIRYNTDTTVSVIVTDVDTVTVSVFLQDYPNKTKAFSARQVEVHKNQPESVVMHLFPSDLPENEAKNDELRYVYLTAESTDPRFPFDAQSVPILVTGNSGYIFIQTDKPIYNPRQKVLIRILPADENMRPSEWPLQMDIINPQGVVVDRLEMTWDGDKFLSHFFTLPSIPVMGNWSVTAGYVNGLTTKTTVGFEVKEYVLPAFSVKVVTERSYILANDEVFRINFEAKYVYGRAVQGRVTYESQCIPQVMFNSQIFQLIEGGHGAFVEGEWIRMANGYMGFPDGARLYIKASVRETATGKEETIHDRKIVLLNTPYQILFTQSQDYFKPGMRYYLHLIMYYENYTRNSQIDFPKFNVSSDTTSQMDTTSPEVAQHHHRWAQTSPEVHNITSVAQLTEVGTTSPEVGTTSPRWHNITRWHHITRVGTTSPEVAQHHR